MNRRTLLKTSLGAGLLAAGPTSSGFSAPGFKRPTLGQLNRAAAAPVLKTKYFKSPVKIASIELLKADRYFLVRARSTDGAVGYAVSNESKMRDYYPIFLHCVAPRFIGRDARDLDKIIDDTFKANYKMQGQALWVPVASAEFAVLDLLGNIAGKSVGQLLGEVGLKEVAIYRASGNRGNTAEEEVAILQKLIAETGAMAVKFKVGGRMSKNADSLPGRSEALIPLARKVLGDKMVLYADSNGSYDAKKGIEIGRIMEEHNFGFYEEPCPFDCLEETKQVADAVNIPIAGGEQESSMRRFRWMIYNNAVQIVQPDLFYYGGFIRSIRVARMAAKAGLTCMPHMSGSGLGFLYVCHFAACVPNAGPHHEYKGRFKIPISCDTSSLLSENGKIRVPTGPGIGVTIDPDFLRKAEIVTG